MKKNMKENIKKNIKKINFIFTKTKRADTGLCQPSLRPCKTQLANQRLVLLEDKHVDFVADFRHLNEIPCVLEELDFGEVRTCIGYQHSVTVAVNHLERCLIRVDDVLDEDLLTDGVAIAADRDVVLESTSNLETESAFSAEAEYVHDATYFASPCASIMIIDHKANAVGKKFLRARPKRRVSGFRVVEPERVCRAKAQRFVHCHVVYLLIMLFSPAAMFLTRL